MNAPISANPVDSNTTLAVWNRLQEIRSLTFAAKSHNGNTGWCGKGKGDVRVEVIDTHTILFHEQGIWKSETNRKFAFHNLYRWTRIESTAAIRLEHLRFGFDRAVFLFELRIKTETELESASPHVCGNDLYSATMSLQSKSLELAWTVKGPNKNEEIRYRYFIR